MTTKVNGVSSISYIFRDIAFSGSGLRFELKVTDNNGVLIRDYVPALDSDGVVCVYDKVNDICHYFKNTSNLMY